MSTFWYVIRKGAQIYLRLRISYVCYIRQFPFYRTKSGKQSPYGNSECQISQVWSLCIQNYQYCSKILRSVTHGWFVLQSFATSIKTEALLSERFCSISVSVNWISDKVIQHQGCKNLRIYGEKYATLFGNSRLLWLPKN